jgi:hypothetical protein
MRYAEGTSVPIERTKGEMERVLGRYGAEEFACFTSAKEGVAAVGFVVRGRAVRMRLKLPSPDIFAKTDRGRARTLEASRRDWEAACRQSWRCLLLVVRAKLEAIDSGIATFEDEFLAYFVMPGGGTLGDRVRPQLDAMRGGASLMLGMDGKP